MDFRTEVEIEAPADRAWSVLGDRFFRVCEWASAIVTSTPSAPGGDGGAPAVGLARACGTAGVGPFAPGEVTERITRYDPELRVLEYVAVSGLPSFVAHAQNRYEVVDRGDGRCVVRIHATLQLRGAARVASCLVAWQLRRVGARFGEELKHVVETGRPHPRKERLAE